MKRTVFDKIIGTFSPERELKRLQARARIEMATRAYDVAKNYAQSDWIAANSNDANEELRNAIKPGRNKARSLVQNAPYAVKAVDVIVGETVGCGIVPNIKGKSKRQEKQLKDLWDKWAGSTECDYEKRNNYYGLQDLVMRSVVESGECLTLPRFDGEMIRLQTLESDFINTEKDTGKYKQGIEVDGNGRRLKYCLFKQHPGGRIASTETVEIAADRLAHVYRQKRPGQLRGITWAHAVVEKMKDFDDYQFATLLRQKVAACFAGFITTSGTDQLLDPEKLKEKRQAEFNLQPATYKYLNQGEDFKQASPPGVDGYSDFNRETLRSIAGGWGISYESMTGDYSQSNYSSSRMGHLQMRKNIELWRWNMLIPQFCDPTFKWFLEYAEKLGFDISGVTVKWVPPAYSMIDPDKEIAATNKEVRAGYKSWSEAVQEQGRDPEQVLKEIVDDCKKFDDNKLILDIDPRKTSQQGLVQSTLTKPAENKSDNPPSDNPNDNNEDEKKGQKEDE